jgi:leader peptidase (prepilin peptidase) / N-methyltransferase
MFDGIDSWMLSLWWTVMGLFVGSFLNVAIYRLPAEGMSVMRPVRSHCPKCDRELGWLENIPILSWALQRARCKGCAAPISVRYPLVEALTALCWYVVAEHTPAEDIALLLVRVTVVSGLLVATFVDFDCFEIPDEVSIGGMWLAPVACLLVPVLHSDTHVALMASDGALEVTRFGALTGSLAGLAVGGGALWGIGWIGSRIYGKEAMGFGDVKLLAAGGGFVGPGGALAALMLASLFASVFGLLNIGRFFFLTRSRARKRGRAPRFKRSVRIARVAGAYLPFGPYLALGIGIVLLYWNDVVQLWP